MHVVWELLKAVALGALGGLGNCLLTESAFLAPSRVQRDGGRTALDPGWIGTVGLGAIAGLLAYFSSGQAVMGLPQLSLCLLAGLGGSNFINSLLKKNEVDTLQQKNKILTDALKDSVERAAKETDK